MGVEEVEGWGRERLHNYVGHNEHFMQISTTNLRVKEVSKSPLRVNDGDVVSEGLDVQETGILYEFPLFRISYCGTNPTIPEAFSFVAKDTDGK